MWVTAGIIDTLHFFTLKEHVINSSFREFSRYSSFFSISKDGANGLKTGKKMNVLGVIYGHDSSAALIIDGKIVADIAEERFTRIKNDHSFPVNSINYCLEVGGIDSTEIDYLVIPDKHIRQNFFTFFDIPDSINIYVNTEKEQLVRTAKKLPEYLKRFKLSEQCHIKLIEHHLSHAASTCYSSGLSKEKSLVITMDGVGNGTSTAIWRFQNNKIIPLKLMDKSSSLSWFYSNATEALDWRHGSEEWKLMGLAPYGESNSNFLKGYYPEFKKGELVKSHAFPDFHVLDDHGAYHYHGKDASELKKLVKQIGRENFAAEVQRVVEQQALNIIIPWLEKEGTRNICCSGGFFHNVKFNQKLWETGMLDNHWVYPNAGDSGLAVGAALYTYYSINHNENCNRLEDLYKGPEYSDDEISKILDERFIKYKYVENPSRKAAEYLSKNLVVGWFQGRMESGPRALGNRSILMSPLRAENKDIINKKVKFREGFRPFAPSLLIEKKEEYLENSRNEEFMTCSFSVKKCKVSIIPAVTHIDETTRPHMVKSNINPLYYDLIKEFGDITGEYIVLNSSFNVKGEPIVCNPREAIKCFYDTGMDILILGKFVIEKSDLGKRMK